MIKYNSIIVFFGSFDIIRESEGSGQLRYTSIKMDSNAYKFYCEKCPKICQNIFSLNPHHDPDKLISTQQLSHWLLYTLVLHFLIINYFLFFFSDLEDRFCVVVMVILTNIGKKTNKPCTIFCFKTTKLEYCSLPK